MRKIDQRPAGDRSPSKYATKLAGRESGAIPAFEFTELKTEASTPADTVEEIPGILHLTVKRIVLQSGCIFLTSSTGKIVFMGLNIVERDLTPSAVQRRMILECAVDENPNGKGLRSTKILSVVSELS